MIRLAARLEIATGSEGAISSVRIVGRNGCEHETGTAGLASLFGSPDREGFRALSGRISVNGWPFRRAARHRLANGTYVLTLGRFASAVESAQRAAIESSPAGYETWSGMFGRLSNKTPLAIGDPMLSATTNSRGYVAFAYDPDSLVGCVRTREGQAVLDFLENGLNSGSLSMWCEPLAFGFAASEGRDAAIALREGLRTPDAIHEMHATLESAMA